MPGCFCGDYNITRLLKDRNRVRPISREMNDFDKFITDWDLVDLLLFGAKYTWSNLQENPICSRIDRFIINSKCDEFFSGTHQVAKPRLTSDHSPLQLSLSMVINGPRPFKFELMWLQDGNLYSIMEVWWRALHFRGNPGFIFCKKLQALKGLLKEWNKNTFGKVDKLVNDSLVKIGVLDTKQRDGTTTEEDRIDRVNEKKEYLEWAKHENIRLRNKCKQEWIEEGDKNTTFFHRNATFRNISNFIGSLRVEGNLTEDQDLINYKALSKAFMKLYTGMIMQSDLSWTISHFLLWISLKSML
ncbi:uncharacterized protein LOC113291602 [Papaver somniferum]|uniref:uncharacterized protein LOC113291602 n=1 Tax=Papaver somniferum TaxID=3469 RepID=UPI000E7026D0|nr:uncharacterized protein LOC113291602 [Papaver somniferum]